MGSYNLTGFASNTSIGDNTNVKVFLCNLSNDFVEDLQIKDLMCTSLNSECAQFFFKPLSIPFDGIYTDYGRVKVTEPCDVEWLFDGSILPLAVNSIEMLNKVLNFLGRRDYDIFSKYFDESDDPDGEIEQYLKSVIMLIEDSNVYDNVINSALLTKEYHLANTDIMDVDFSLHDCELMNSGSTDKFNVWKIKHNGITFKQPKTFGKAIMYIPEKDINVELGYKLKALSGLLNSIDCSNKTKYFHLYNKVQEPNPLCAGEVRLQLNNLLKINEDDLTPDQAAEIEMLMNYEYTSYDLFNNNKYPMVHPYYGTIQEREHFSIFNHLLFSTNRGYFPPLNGPQCGEYADERLFNTAINDAIAIHESNLPK